MKIVRTFDVSAEEFFDALVAKLRIEIEESSDAPISAEIAAGTDYGFNKYITASLGFAYAKQGGNGGEEKLIPLFP